MKNYWLNQRRYKKNQKIVVGSIVKDLNTGTLMTVSSINNLATIFGVYTEYYCNWFVGLTLHSGIFSEYDIVLEKT